MHSVTDRRTDRQTDDRIMPIADSLLCSNMMTDRINTSRLRVYYGSVSGDRCCMWGSRCFLCIHQMAALFCVKRTISWLPSWWYDVVSEIRLHQWTRNYLKNIPANFHPDPS